MKFFNSTLFAGFCLFGMCGCGLESMVGHQRHSLPTEWKHAGGFPVGSADRDLAHWWNRFEDPTLTKVIAEALKNSPNMASASARVRESQARRSSEAAALFPTLSGSTSVASSTSWFDAGGQDSQSSSAARLNAAWEVDLFGKRRSSLEAAAAQLGATQENFRSVQAALASEIAIAYTTLRVNEAGLQVLLRTIKTREETSRLANWRKDAGEADSLESDQAVTSLEQARAGQPALEQSISQTRNLIARLSGENPGALDALLGAGKQAIPNPSRTLAIGIPADTLRQRPDVRIAGYQLLAAAATSRVVQAERFPTLSLTGSLGVNALGAGKIFNPETTTAGVIAGLSGPIFDAGRIRSNIQAQSAVEEQTFQNYRSTILTALSEVEDSLIACRRTTERLVILEKATAAAREAAGLAQQRYEAGVTDILTVLDAQRSLLGLEDSLFSTRASRAIAYIRLYKALGGGWS
ncbi:MAG: efflux transporter outer membrane subunit [Akkermansiaceae bacterium]|nr:efflux transporter outer membrane subunit [Akkermansiaceae bacterium]